MDAQTFQNFVARLERESAQAPRRYRAKVAALVLLGFAILALLLSAIGFGVLLLAGFSLAMLYTGGAALLVLLKFGKLLILLALPLWLMLRGGLRMLFVRLPAPQGHAVTPEAAPALFAALERMRRSMNGPRFHHVLLVGEPNAAVAQRPAFGLVGWPRNYLLLGLPLLESLSPEEALAVVAHEYGHLAGSHGQFSAFVYRLRGTWGTIQAYADHIQGWLGRLVTPLVRWYAPYFNAYTFVLARADEYHADAASAELVGALHMARALKRVNVVGSRHSRFMEQTFERVRHDAAPPPDLLSRWAEQAAQAPDDGDARRWLGDALDRVGNVADTHPTLRARLAALPPSEEAPEAPPPALEGASAAAAWFGAGLDAARARLQSEWAAAVADGWEQRHAEVRQQRERRDALRAQAERTPADELEMLRLSFQLEPEIDLRDALAAYNAAHADAPLALFLEGVARLDRDERAGLALLERAAELDPDATKAVCERAYAYLMRHQERDAADACAVRWRERDALEARRAHELGHVEPTDTLAEHGLDAEMVAAVRAKLVASARVDIAELYLARRVIAADARAAQWLIGVRLTRWARWRGRQREVVDRLAALGWPLPLMFVALDGTHAPLRPRFRALSGARLV